jgi:hypothetical protein
LIGIFDRAPPLTNELVVYRGLKTYEELFDPKLTNFTSTSRNIDIAKYFHFRSDLPQHETYSFDADKQPGCCLLRILLPRGSKVLVPMLPGTRYGEQEEILLQPGGELILTSQETVDGGPEHPNVRLLQKNVVYIPGTAVELTSNEPVQVIASEDEQVAFLVRTCMKIL